MQPIDWLRREDLPEKRREYFRETAAVANYDPIQLLNLPLLKVKLSPKQGEEAYIKITNQKSDNPYISRLQRLVKYAAENGGSYKVASELERTLPMTSGELEQILSESVSMLQYGLREKISLEGTRIPEISMKALTAKTEKDNGVNLNSAYMTYLTPLLPYGSRN